MRESGILLHITSLPSLGGIGTLGACAYRFVDYLRDAGMQIWQMLPIGPTGYGQSPYQSASTFAGNPLLIDCVLLIEQGFLGADSYAPLPDSAQVDFDAVAQQKEMLLRQAFARSYSIYQTEVRSFAAQEKWLTDYALFTALKAHFGGVSWQEWPDEGARLRQAEALEKYRSMLADEIAYHSFVQFLFYRQWFALKEYANRQGIRFFGDMPIYVALDSVDAWAQPGVFQLDQKRRPVRVAGVPPDYFSADGQLWGNPLYDWKKLRRQKYHWWINRLAAMGRFFDLVRVDHFIGFANFYSIPAGAKTARVGKWVKGPGKGFFRRVKKELPQVNIIAEDLGEVNARVKRLLRYCGYPGMKVLCFAFGGGENNPHLPQHHTQNCVVYTGTHDNDTVLGWWHTASENVKAHARRVLHITDDSQLTDAMIAAALQSVADIAIIPMQDYLRLDGMARMNVPGTVGGNWGWRMTPSDEMPSAATLRALNLRYDRGGEISK